MRRHFFTLLSFFFFATTIFAQNIQSPDEFLGYELGTRFTNHHRVMDYYEYLVNNTDMVHLEEYGRTNEHRLLQVAFVSAPENLENLDRIRKNHLANAGLGTAESSANKAIVWLSYNVHGNESSSTEASMKTIYELVTSKKAWLQNTVVIIDPCINPDGRDRYVNWYNQVASVPFNSHQKATEHNEPWPGGRPNHYLFDLNRDWAWATQIETRRRLMVYNQWLPHIHVDFHEQGINEPYYFAPAAEPFHEVITDWQRDFQTQIGKNHAGYFDKEGWLYFTRERFDLFYPSYGDTYPTFNGAIGMTYEQAGHGRAGLGITNDEGDLLTLKDRILHHHTTGLSTVEISSKNVAKLNEEFKKYFAKKDFEYKSYVLEGNQDRILKLTELLDRHEIRYGFSNGTVKGFDYETSSQKSKNVTDALVVSTNQPKANMVKVLFEPNAKLSDSLTYDITAWSLPYAYGLKTTASKTIVSPNATITIEELPDELYKANASAYVAPWNTIKDAAFLSQLLQKGIRVRFSEKTFVSNGTTFEKGSLIITKSDHKNTEAYAKTVIDLASEHKIALTSLSSNFSDNGVDMGSPDIKEIKMPKVAVMSGKGTQSLGFGELWYFFEQELKFPVTNVNSENFSANTLHSFNILILPDGNYGKIFNAKQLKTLKNWISRGGKVIAMKGALRTFEGKEGFGLKKKEQEKDDEKKDIIAYAKGERQNISNYITGAIFKTKVDTTHPLAFGYDDSYFTLKLGSAAYDYIKDGYTVSYLEENTPVSGFAGYKAKKNIKNTLVFGEKRIGKGSMIYMVDNPMFRAFWENGKLFFANAIFMVNNNSFEL
ncbi:zinc carboxypeptidase [Kordia sp. SMS9]|uniref:M14 metallopeptidase family protein n=1 Tax=Kordia sp. SMS9 TaxID=2282170 RepID=UPI000E0E00B3|nr:M14 metallopeptidase family protein [Kordia sp. SMS9]AXG70243.1 zinc carboxypeptidase [Kordia sp. SMS9]